MSHPPLLAVYREAELLVERLGTWFLYEVRDAENLEHLVGFLGYVAHGLGCRKTRSKESQRLAQVMLSWRRMARWVSGLDREHHREIADQILGRLRAQHERQRKPLPFYVAGSGHPWLTASDRPRRQPGRPRVRPAKPVPRQECPHCAGQGYV